MRTDWYRARGSRSANGAAQELSLFFMCAAREQSSFSFAQVAPAIGVSVAAVRMRVRKDMVFMAGQGIIINRCRACPQQVHCELASTLAVRHIQQRDLERAESKGRRSA